MDLAGNAIFLYDVQQHRHVMTNTAAQYKQMPNAMTVFDLVVGDEKSDTQGVEQASSGQPIKA